MPDTPPPSPTHEKTRVTVELENPIQRGETALAQIVVRKPGAGELRGLTLQALGQSDVNALLTLLPRITEPPLAAHEVEKLEVEDLSSFAGVVFDFFLTSDARSKIRTLLGS